MLFYKVLGHLTDMGRIEIAVTVSDQTGGHTTWACVFMCVLDLSRSEPFSCVSWIFPGLSPLLQDTDMPAGGEARTASS